MTLRPYQKRASDAAVECFERGTWNGLLVLPTSAGKSHIIADIARRVDTPLLILQPSREILEQNHEKILNVGMYDVGIYSASLSEKNIRKITLATIGSVYNHMDDFRLFRFVIVDEAHRVDPLGGMYKEYLTSRSDRVVIGLTATPFRLSGYMGCTMLKFLTRMNPRIFDKVLHVCQIKDMVEGGWLCSAEYFDVTGKIAFDLKRVKLNSTGLDYDEQSLEIEYRRSKFAKDLLLWTMMVLRPNDGTQRNGVLVFCRFVREADVLVRGLEAYGVAADVITGDTPKDERKMKIEYFKTGRIKVLANVNCLSEGWDYPALDTIVMASPTRSLTRYMQQVGRVLRPYEGKRAWVVDLSGNYRFFGKAEDIMIENPYGGNGWIVTSNGRQLSGVLMS